MSLRQASQGCFDDGVVGFEDAVGYQLERRYRQTFSIGLRSGAREDGKIRAMLPRIVFLSLGAISYKAHVDPPVAENCQRQTDFRLATLSSQGELPVDAMAPFVTRTDFSSDRSGSG